MVSTALQCAPVSDDRSPGFSEFTTFLELDCMLDKDASIEYNIINSQVDNLPVD